MLAMNDECCHIITSQVATVATLATSQGSSREIQFPKQRCYDVAGAGARCGDTDQCEEVEQLRGHNWPLRHKCYPGHGGAASVSLGHTIT